MTPAQRFTALLCEALGYPLPDYEPVEALTERMRIRLAEREAAR